VDNVGLSGNNSRAGEMVEAKRAGRPWGPARGSSQEINELVGLIRAWLDASGVSVRALHQRLTPEHFNDQQVPELHWLRDRLAGVELERLPRRTQRARRTK
jgi:hypothetical protein